MMEAQFAGAYLWRRIGTLTLLAGMRVDIEVDRDPRAPMAASQSRSSPVVS
jgi:hypothetical protein